MVAPSVLGVFAMGQTALADETESQSEILDQVETYHNGGASLDQVNSVFQLRDVSPGDWAFEALRNLVERYGCIAGYPDGTFRGNRALTRYEFAAGLNACLQQIERLIAANTGGSGDVNQGDLATLQRLTQEFEAELATLGTRVDNLEGRVGFLEDNQFSTTTKLSGFVIFDLAAAFGDGKALAAKEQNISPDIFGEDDPGTDVEEEVHFTNRVSIDLNTSFTGRDRLRTRLEFANNVTLGDATGSFAATRNYSAGPEEVTVDQLIYTFPIGDNITAHVAAQGLLVDNVFDAGSTASFAYNSVNLFVAYNNLIYDVSSSDGAGVGANIVLNDLMQLDLGYFTQQGVSSNPDEGLFGGDYSAGAQLGLDLGDLDLSFAYLRSFQSGRRFSDLSGFVGSTAAAFPFLEDSDSDGLRDSRRANTANHYGIQGNWRISERFSVGGYFGLVDAQAEEGDDSDVEIVNWLVNASFPDLGKEGSVLILAFGQPPKLTDSEGAAVPEDPDTGYLLDVEYHYAINDNISIAPAINVLFNPDHNDNNDTIYVGRLRTLFSF
ncbi:UNVERIFIED_CONTAM: S-layer protein [Euhalothece sp. KZN 001]